MAQPAEKLPVDTRTDDRAAILVLALAGAAVSIGLRRHDATPTVTVDARRQEAPEEGRR